MAFAIQRYIKGGNQQSIFPFSFSTPSFSPKMRGAVRARIKGEVAEPGLKKGLTPSDPFAFHR
jgi:hypothetical protein